MAAAYNWPQRYEPWLGEMRVRLGFGPSGEAASERRAIEVPDVFADPSLEDWQEVASELGFRALVALPLQTSSRVLGAVTFYFADARGFSTERRGLLRIVAAQMAATAEKAALIDDLRRANAALTESKAELEQQYLAVLEARRVKDEFLTNVTHELRTPLTAVMGYISLLQEEFSGPLTDHQRNDLSLARDASDRLLALIDNLLEMTTLKRGATDVQVETFDPRDLLRDAATATKGRPDSTELRIEVPPRSRAVHAERPAQARESAGEPHQQRLQVHRAWRRDGIAGSGERPRALPCAGHRHWRPARIAASHLR